MKTPSSEAEVLDDNCPVNIFVVEMEELGG